MTDLDPVQNHLTNAGERLKKASYGYPPKS
jgi:hypothetical protein